MELTYTDGCITTSLDIDGVESIDMSIEDFRKVIHKIVDKIDDFAELQNIFMNFVECNGELIDEYNCSCCGDYVTTYKINI
nr:MAG TPA: hypothetical protein [Caudoviricetes sp.]